MLRRRALLPLAAALAATCASPAAALAAPVNDHLASATVLSSGSSPSPTQYTNVGATLEAGESALPGAFTNSVWFKWVPSAAGGANASVEPDDLGQRVRVFRLPAGKALSFANLVAAEAGSGYVPYNSTFTRSRWMAAAQGVYYIQVGGTPRSHLLEVTQDTVKPPAPSLMLFPLVSGPSLGVTWSLSGDAVKTDCRIDGVPKWGCPSGQQLTGLSEGSHSFEVWAYDAYGNRSTTTASSWQVDATAPDTTATLSHDGIVLGSEPGATFECWMKATGWQSCSSPVKVSHLPDGQYEFFARATDVHGNVDPTPASRGFQITNPVPVTPPAEPASISPGPTATSTATAPAATAPGTTSSTSTSTGTAATAGLRLVVPRTATRARLRQGLRVKVTAPKAMKLGFELEQGRRSLVRVVTTVKRGTTTVTLRARGARAGAATLVVRQGSRKLTRRIAVR